MLKYIKIVIWLLIFAVLLAGISLYWKYQKTHPSTDNAYIQANVVTLSPQVSGVITQVNVVNQQFVKKGQTLLTIDPQPFELAVKAAEAKLDLTIQKIKALKDSVKTAQAQVEERESQLDVTIKNSNRIFALAKTGQVSKAQADDAQNNLRLARAALTAAKSQLAEIVETLGEPGENNAEIRAAKAALAQAKLQLSYTTIKAPADGQIVNFNTRQGDLVTTGTPLFSLVEQNIWWVAANFKETQLTQLRPGQSATIHVDMYPKYTFHGTIQSISPGSGTAFALLPPENATGNWVKVTQRVPVKITIDNISNNYPLRIGTSATVTVHIK